ncbi:hypothetical protein GHO37_02820 [Pseudomonas helleri]|uniref:Uncharacterized protein n=1 Tax=Pseudomonas helleri TaxID=1608996 RepID=A0A7X1YDM3_9PSED|nr:hypothetical protein [Pseudomonas helleri]MQT89665.1 hypothetical protein [Pseudomonas helleri]MQT96853.1 hypothetical protein [Pseudomonas helleri]MQU02954.1 hypothetical protein [Pseudomonas sp. FSL R10-2245]MQU34842.1 hypothetical protein [Pseudomonas helleri]
MEPGTGRASATTNDGTIHNAAVPWPGGELGRGRCTSLEVSRHWSHNPDHSVEAMVACWDLERQGLVASTPRTCCGARWCSPCPSGARRCWFASMAGGRRSSRSGCTPMRFWHWPGRAWR